MKSDEKRVLIIIESTDTGTDKKLIDSILEKHRPFGDDNVKVNYIFGQKPGGITDVIRRIKDLHVAPEITGQDKPDILIVVVDADDNPKERHKEIINSFDKKTFSVSSTNKIGEFSKEENNKIRTGIFLFPNSKDIGSLETLCFNAVETDKIEEKKECIEKYIQCLQENEIDQEMTQNNRSKAKFRILNATPEPDYNYVRNAIKNLNLEHNCFEPLISFFKKAI